MLKVLWAGFAMNPLKYKLRGLPCHPTNIELVFSPEMALFFQNSVPNNIIDISGVIALSLISSIDCYTKSRLYL